MQIRIYVLALALFSIFLPAHASSLPDAPTLYALSGVPPEWADRNEPHEQRIDRFRPVAAAVNTASPHEQERAVLLALAHHESMLAKRIQNDQCRDDECDAGKAKGLWQIQIDACPDAKKIHGMPPTDERLKLEAACALYVYRAAKDKCGGSVQGGLMGYRGKCQTTDGVLRRRTFETFAYVLRYGWPKPPRGWQRDSNPSREDRRIANERLRELDAQPGDFFKLPSGAGVLVEWHWHEFGGEASPRGWHLGLTLYHSS